MKKLISAFVLILCLPALGFSQFTHAGLQAAYSTEAEQVGFGLGGIYRVNDDIKLYPNFLYYLPNKVDTDLGTRKFQWWTVNLDGNYVILKESAFEGYGIMGLNISGITAERDEVEMGQPFKDKNSLTRLGLNIGAGARLKAGDKIMPFAEIRYTLGSVADFTFTEVSTSQFSIFAGLLIRIAEDKERTATEDY